MGTEAGLSSDDIQTAVGDTFHERSDRDQLLILATDEMIDRHSITDATWSGLSNQFADTDLLELLFLIGSYVCLAMVLNSVEREPEINE